MQYPSLPSVRECVPVALGIVVCAAVSFALQPPIVAGNGFGWDGLAYADLYRRIVFGTVQPIDFPFCLRVGAPFAAGLLGLDDIVQAFRVVNGFFAAVFALLVYVIVRNAGMNIVAGLTAVSLTIVPYFAPLRYTAFVAVYTDPGFLALLSGAVLLLQLRRMTAAFALLSVAYLFREAAIYLVPWFLVTALLLGLPLRRILLHVVVACALMLSANQLIEQLMGCDASHLKIALKALYERVTDPLNVVRGLAALSMTAAPVVFVHAVGRLTPLDRSSLFGLLLAAVLAMLGGSDSTRIFYSFLPIYLLLILRVMIARGPLFLLVSLLGYGVTNRFARPLLEPQTYLPQRDMSGYFTQFPDHAGPETALLILAVWFSLFSLYELLAARMAPIWEQTLRRALAAWRRRPLFLLHRLLRRVRAVW
jgi:hypothetical protein